MLNKINRHQNASSRPAIELGRGVGMVLLLASAAGLMACSGSPTPNYYTLTSKMPSVQNTTVVNANVRMIEVLPVGLPDRLNRAPMLLQDANGKSKVLDNDRWTSTLGAELRDGLSAGLQQKLGAVDRYSSGMTGGKVTYRIATDFARFDIVERSGTKSTFNSATAKDIEVVVAWIIKRDDPNRPLTPDASAKGSTLNQQLSCRMAFSTPVPGNGQHIADVVSTSQTALNRVVDAVAASVVVAEGKTSAKVEGAVCS